MMSLRTVPTQASRASRRIPLRSKSSFRGAFVTNFDGPCAVVFESRLELMTAMLLLSQQGIVDLQDQPPAVEYADEDGEIHSHTFDYLATFEDGTRVAVAVKPHHSATKRNFRHTLGLIAGQMGEFANKVVLVTEKQFTRDEADNAELLHAIRDEVDDEADIAVRSVLSDLNGETTVGEIVKAARVGGRGYRSVVRHVARHHLVLRSRGRIRYETRVAKVGS